MDGSEINLEKGSETTVSSKKLTQSTKEKIDSLLELYKVKPVSETRE
ncbi:MAG: hypothetical protein LBO09_02835 [Candidatus Peribacteria bacterium]|jgi:hypothetical protein|nr:hypothetical protein [Candidatus Peribacteria bacterium]